MPGLAATPIVLISGAVVPLGVPPDSWEPFDRQGFAAYRIAMETMATLALLAVFSLGAGRRRSPDGPVRSPPGRDHPLRDP